MVFPLEILHGISQVLQLPGFLIQNQEKLQEMYKSHGPCFKKALLRLEIPLALAVKSWAPAPIVRLIHLYEKFRI